MIYNKPYTLKHHGVKGMKWGVRRYQNKDGTLTNEGKVRKKSLLESEAKHLAEKNRRSKLTEAQAVKELEDGLSSDEFAINIKSEILNHVGMVGLHRSEPDDAVGKNFKAVRDKYDKLYDDLINEYCSEWSIRQFNKVYSKNYKDISGVEPMSTLEYAHNILKDKDFSYGKHATDRLCLGSNVSDKLRKGVAEDAMHKAYDKARKTAIYNIADLKQYSYIRKMKELRNAQKDEYISAVTKDLGYPDTESVRYFIERHFHFSSL